MSDINIGAIAEQLNYKVDLDMHNSQKPYIVETYIDSNNRNSGYIILSNKICVQWGRTGQGTSGNISFLKEFTGDMFFFNFFTANGNTAWQLSEVVVNYNSTGFSWNRHDASDHSWIFAGYIL